MGIFKQALTDFRFEISNSYYPHLSAFRLFILLLPSCILPPVSIEYLSKQFQECSQDEITDYHLALAMRAACGLWSAEAKTLSV
jgi:hypothetical protein